MKTKSSHIVVCMLAVLSAICGSLYAEVVTCVNTGYTTGPVAGSGWSDGMTPSDDKDYLVNNEIGRAHV